MAKLSLVLKQKKPVKFSTRAYTRCHLCGNPRGYIRKLKMCRKCFRELAHSGELPGFRKASW